MNEYVKQKLVMIGGVILLVFCMWLIISGQRTVSLPSLIRMLSGLGGILVMLWIYNRSQR